MKTLTPVKIAIVAYPYVLKSAVYGLEEMFLLANNLCQEQGLITQFKIDIVDLAHIPHSKENHVYTAVILPPSMESNFYLTPEPVLTQWLVNKHQAGSILCSACAGAFIIAATGLLDNREVTTHWKLVALIQEHFPKLQLKPDKITVNDGDIITAGGMMSWLDLGLELVAQIASPNIMRQLGKVLVVDTGHREQRYYQQFSPTFAHGDELILKAQKIMQTDYKKIIKMAALAGSLNITERTFLRRFVKSTGFKPSEYIQRLRIQKACDLLETTQHSFEVISNLVGYEDTSACRRVFVRIIGLTPKEFKNRFVNSL